MRQLWSIRGLAVLAVVVFLATSAFVTGGWSEPAFFGSRCASCHNHDSQTCDGCHRHKGNLSAVTDMPEYSPGAAVTVTLRGGSRGGWIRGLLYDENNTEIFRATGPTGTGDDGQPGAVTFPVELQGTAPMQPGDYTWEAAWYGNPNNGGSMHGEERTPVTFRVSGPTAVDDQQPGVLARSWGWIKGLFEE